MEDEGSEDEDGVVDAAWSGEDDETAEPEGKGKTLGRSKKDIPREKSLAVRQPGALARASDAPVKALAPSGGSRKTLGRKVEAPAAPSTSSKTLGRKVKGAEGTPAANVLSRALVRQKIADRLAGRLTPAELAGWARSKWSELQRGASAEGGYEDMLEDLLLSLSSLPASKLSDSELVNMMTRLDR